MVYPLMVGKSTKWLTKQYLPNTPEMSRGSRSNVKRLIIHCWASNVPKAFVDTVVSVKQPFVTVGRVVTACQLDMCKNHGQLFGSLK
jgi:hypothetical protein